MKSTHATDLPNPTKLQNQNDRTFEKKVPQIRRLALAI